MATKIQIKATMFENDTYYPPKGEDPKLEDREFAFHRGENALYIGNEKGKPIKLCQASDVGKVAKKVDFLPDNADIATVVARVNELISVLRESGLMHTQ